MIIDNTYASKSSWKENLFKGKVVFVTGGAGTICKVQTKALVALGCNAVIIGRNQKKTEAAAKEIEKVRPGSKVVGIGNVDVRRVEDLVKAVEKAIEVFQRLDFLICGAAGNFLADFNHISANAFKSVVSIDLLGTFNTIKAAFPELKKTKGSILIVSATLQYNGLPLQSHASAAKAGVDALSNSLAVEFGPLGIKINCIAPGAIGGDTPDGKWTEGMQRLSGKNPEKLHREIPLQRLGAPSDIAEATVFLFSPAASYITGDIIVVDGGMWHTGFKASNAPSPQEMVKLLNDKPKL